MPAAHFSFHIIINRIRQRDRRDGSKDAKVNRGAEKLTELNHEKVSELSRYVNRTCALAGQQPSITAGMKFGSEMNTNSRNIAITSASRWPWACTVFALIACVPTAIAEDRPYADALAVLEAHCVKCHGGEKTKGGLNLLT